MESEVSLVGEILSGVVYLVYRLWQKSTAGGKCNGVGAETEERNNLVFPGRR